MADNPLSGLWGSLFPSAQGNDTLTGMSNMIQSLVVMALTVAIIAGICYLAYRFWAKPKMDEMDVKNAKKLRRIAIS